MTDPNGTLAVRLATLPGVTNSDVISTGGGCRAIGITRTDGYSLLITNGDADVPLSEDGRLDYTLHLWWDDAEMSQSGSLLSLSRDEAKALSAGEAQDLISQRVAAWAAAAARPGRAQAKAALDAYGTEEGTEEAITDLIADLMHLADTLTESSGDVVAERAAVHYAAEISGEN